MFSPAYTITIQDNTLKSVTIDNPWAISVQHGEAAQTLGPITLTLSPATPFPAVTYSWTSTYLSATPVDPALWTYADLTASSQTLNILSIPTATPIGVYNY